MQDGGDARRVQVREEEMRGRSRCEMGRCSGVQVREGEIQGGYRGYRCEMREMQGGDRGRVQVRDGEMCGGSRRERRICEEGHGSYHMYMLQVREF